MDERYIQTDLSQISAPGAAEQLRQVGTAEKLKLTNTTFLVREGWSSQERLDAGLPPDLCDVAIVERECGPEEILALKRG